MGSYLRLLSLTLLLLLASANTLYSGSKFSAASDVAWDCIYPWESEGVCRCGVEPYVRYGYKMTFWEPIAVIEISRCKESSYVDGKSCKSEADRSEGSSGSGEGGSPLESLQIWQKGSGGDEEGPNRYYAKYLAAPFLWRTMLYDDLCLAKGDFVYLWKSEWVSFWQFEDESWHLFPEGLLYGNYNYIYMSCGIDCVQSSLPYAVSNLSFVAMHLSQAIDRGCMGCWGVTYPVAGESSTQSSDVTTAALLAARVVHYLHRTFLLMSNYDPNYCAYHPWPWIDRAQYKLQLAYPVKSSYPTTCFPVGFTQALWETTKKYPGKEEWVFILWRMRKCCMA